ncbi:MAG: FHA domain-containing protein [Planctomycetaceae bacterium]|nr:FHA domain-containing protein [Planctomycetaceae bacterium]
MMRRLDRRNAARPQANVETVHEAPAVSLILGDGPGSERITGTRLLIGGDTECDVRLEDPEAPSLHTIVHSDRDGVWLDVVISDPPVYVNGEETDWARLEDGDVIEIGLLEMTVQLRTPLPSVVGAWDDDETGIRITGRNLRAGTRPLDLMTRKNLGATALLRAAIERGLATRDSDDEDERIAIVPIRDFGRGTTPTVVSEETVSNEERLDRLVMGLEELAARAELLAHDLDARASGRLRIADTFLEAAERSIEELTRHLNAAETNGPILHAPPEDTRAAA